jgi:hypothetical protein
MTNLESNEAANRAIGLLELVSALEEIRKMAMEHPCFDADCFDRRDIDGLCNQGGDICDWTMVAIHADDALRAYDKPSDGGHKTL